LIHMICYNTRFLLSNYLLNRSFLYPKIVNMKFFAFIIPFFIKIVNTKGGKTQYIVLATFCKDYHLTSINASVAILMPSLNA